MGDSKHGIKLGENDKFEKDLTYQDLLKDEGDDAINVWFEDSAGKKYSIKNIKKHIKQKVICWLWFGHITLVLTRRGEP